MKRVECLAEVLEPRQLLAAIPPVGFDLFTDAAMTTPGLVGTYINSSLRVSSAQNDWRLTQSVAGTRIDPAISFTSNGWGGRAEVGLTNGADTDWENFSVQWDGYVRVFQDGTPLATRSDDGSRMWIDLNGDGKFNSSGSEYVNNHWGTGQGATTGPNSPALAAGVYRIRIQYEEGDGANSMQLLSALPVVRVAYLVPSNRTPQAHAVDSLRNTIRLYQDWYRDQMQRNGFGPKTFRYETEADGVTPRIHVVNLSETDDYLRGDMWGRVNSAASNAGVPIWTEGQVWLLVPETHIQKSDSSIDGGVALGASGGSGIDGGIGMVGSNGLALFKPESLTDNRPYNGLTIPDIGPLPLKQDVSYVWFEGTTISSLASSYLGAGLHEMTHGFGMPHDFRNDDNFDGNLLGNGLRGMRGAVYPELYPNDDTFLSYGQAMALSTLPYFSGKAFPTDRTAPSLSVQTSGTVAPVDGLLQIRFSASDANGLACALLTRNGDQIDEMPLSGTSVSKAFATPYYTPGQTDQYTVLVYDKNGNRRTMEVSVTPTAAANRAVQPFVELSTSTVAVGKPITLDASRGSDPESGGMWSSKVEWDLDGDGVFDTEPSTSLTLTKVFTQAGTRLIRARITDAAGAVSLSAPIGIRVVPTVNDGAASNTYYVRVDPDDPSMLEVFRGSTPVGTPAYTMFRDDARPLTINSGGGTDELIVDFANGSPVPAAGVKFDGGAGNNRIRIVGTSSADGLAMTDSQILAGSLAIDYAHANIQLGRSDTTLTLASLDLQTSARVALASGGVLELHSLAIAPQASLDLQDGDLLIRATAETRQALCDQIARWIANARGNGVWGGNGLTSGVAAGNPRTGLAITINDKGNGQPIFSTFDGLPTDANDILIKYTWNGDVTLDGKVDLADYFLVDAGFIKQTGGYRNGDLDLNGKVDLADYFLIDAAFIVQNSVLGVPRAVWAD